MRNNAVKATALGGVLTAVALVIMCLGGLVPVATYICPMLCALLQFVVLHTCGRRTAWAWYGAVALLSLLIGPDKEAAAVFLLLGYYPIVKPWFDTVRFGWLWKLMLFNGSVLVLYTVLIRLLGLDGVTAEFRELGLLGAAVLLVLGNITFVLLDRLLNQLAKKK